MRVRKRKQFVEYLAIQRGNRFTLKLQRYVSKTLQPNSICITFIVSDLSGSQFQAKTNISCLNRIMDTWIRQRRIHVSMIRLRHDIFVLAWNWDPDTSETIKVIQIAYIYEYAINLLIVA